MDSNGRLLSFHVYFFVLPSSVLFQRSDRKPKGLRWGGGRSGFAFVGTTVALLFLELFSLSASLSSLSSSCFTGWPVPLFFLSLLSFLMFLPFSSPFCILETRVVRRGNWQQRRSSIARSWTSGGRSGCSPWNVSLLFAAIAIASR